MGVFNWGGTTTIGDGNISKVKSSRKGIIGGFITGFIFPVISGFVIEFFKQGLTCDLIKNFFEIFGVK